MLGGRLIPRTYTGIPDYGVVPVHGAPLKHTVNEIVNDLFIVSIFYRLHSHTFFNINFLSLMISFILANFYLFVGRLHKSRANRGHRVLPQAIIY